MIMMCARARARVCVCVCVCVNFKIKYCISWLKLTHSTRKVINLYKILYLSVCFFILIYVYAYFI